MTVTLFQIIALIFLGHHGPLDCSHTWRKKSTILQKPLPHVKGFQLLIIITRSSISDITGVSDRPLKICPIFQKSDLKTFIHANNFIQILHLLFGNLDEKNVIVSYPVVVGLVFSTTPKIVFLILVRTMFTPKRSNRSGDLCNRKMKGCVKHIHD